MIHSMTFGNGMNTFEDFGMMAVERLVFASPAVKTNFVDITGSDNSLDLSEVLTGYPTYEDRKGSFKFRFIDDGTPVRERLSKLMNSVHGKRLTAILSEEPDYYYDARWQVVDPDYKKVGEFADVELEYIAKAYKLELIPRIYEDSFTFEPPTLSQTITLQGTAKPVIPKITINSLTVVDEITPVWVTLAYNNETYILYRTFPKTFILPQIVLKEGIHELTLGITLDPDPNNAWGYPDSATVGFKIEYEGGWL